MEQRTPPSKEELEQTYRRLRMQMRRRMRSRKKKVEKITQQADSSIETDFFSRFYRLKKVRRFVVMWVLLLVLAVVGTGWQLRALDPYYLTTQAVAGGIYREGIVGSFSTANPLFAVSPADTSVSKLVFSSLFVISPNGQLEPDLAQSIAVDETGSIYTVKLKTDVQWHDGEPFTAADVVFTYDQIKNIQTKSPLRGSWQEVDVRAVDDQTVVFTLPNSLASFQYSLTNGIVPQHLLSDLDPSLLRTADFNTIAPIGTGPFRYSDVEVLGTTPENRQEKITLKVNEEYHANIPSIDGVIILTYRDSEKLIQDFDDKQLTSMVGLRTMPDEFADDTTVQSYATPLRSQVMLFLNKNFGVLEDVKVRQALLHATNTDGLLEQLGYRVPKIDSPFLSSHFTYNPGKTQRGYDTARAEQLLAESGWVLNADGIREKEGRTLRLRLISQSLSEYAAIVQDLQQQWKALGIDVEALLQPEADVQAGAIVRHDYDVLLYGIAVGVDPDVFAFWHSSQADPRVASRLNLSEFSNDAADEALEAGRTRSEPALRAVKYEPFLDAWVDESPAIALYQPRFLFVTRGVFEGYRSGQFESAADRFYSIEDWKIRREKTIKTSE